MKFQIHSIGIAPYSTPVALKLLSDMGLENWLVSEVSAEGTVFDCYAENSTTCHLHDTPPFASRGVLEIVSPQKGPNWLHYNNGSSSTVAYLGMHCSLEDLARWKAFFKKRNITIATEMETTGIIENGGDNERHYKYVIFNTRSILGVDIKISSYTEDA